MIYFQLFYTFFLIGLFTFGGGYAMIPMIQNEILSNGWMNEGTLTDFIAVSEITPGPFAINVSTFVGAEVAGPIGSICATFGVVLPSFIIILLLAFVLRKIFNNKYFKGALKGVRPIILALILSTTILLFVKIMFFNGSSIDFNSFAFDRSSFGLLITISLIMFIYKKVYKKSLDPIPMLLLSGLLGLIIFI